MRRILPNQVTIVAQLAANDPGTVVIDADRQESQGEIVTAAGNVQVVYGDILLIADRVTYHRDNGDLTAEGNVFFEQQGQRLTGDRLEMNARTKLGTIHTVTAFTNRTPDGTVLIVDAANATRTDDRTFALRQAILTSCQEAVPKWDLRASRAVIELDDRARIYNALLRIKKIPVFYLPYASISISRKDRTSGFLIPSSGSSTIKGRSLNLAYYQTLGRSADILIRTDIFSKRGIGLGYDFRARTNETSRVNFGSFLVFDRLFGEKGENQGGSSFYADAIHRFGNGFVAVADVNITSSFAFRQIFAENIQTAVSPEERSVFYVNRSWKSWSFNAFFGEQSSFIGDEIVK
ncbi:MAG: LPS-assembly protein LptD, partial [Acidobacteria bacterium]|nr:LPS-assembly protein LptD [Acidobacteriota bacterium]